MAIASRPSIARATPLPDQRLVARVHRRSMTVRLSPRRIQELALPGPRVPSRCPGQTLSLMRLGVRRPSIEVPRLLHRQGLPQRRGLVQGRRSPRSPMRVLVVTRQRERLSGRSSVLRRVRPLPTPGPAMTRARSPRRSLHALRSTRQANGRRERSSLNLSGPLKTAAHRWPAA